MEKQNQLDLSQQNPLSNNLIKVSIRCRPINRRELEMNSTKIVQIINEENKIVIDNQDEEQLNNSYQVDNVFGFDSTQEEIFKRTTLPLIEAAMSGQNQFIFTYGQTGTGKNFTLFGLFFEEYLFGILPRSINHIFGRINQNMSQDCKKYQVYGSMYEIYEEKVYDLLAENKHPLQILNDAISGEFHLSGLTSKKISNFEEFEDLYIQGVTKLKTEQTQLSKISCRAIVIFEITIEIIDTKTNSVKIGKIKMVQFCGSEKHLSNYQYPQELTQSLDVFHSVIDELVEQKKPISEIPFHNSALTKLIKEAFNQTSAISMIFTIGPSNHQKEEAISTLKMAEKCMMLNNLKYL